jgi:hypothetical protein
MSRVETGFHAERVLTLRVSGQYGFETNDATVQTHQSSARRAGYLPRN